MPLTKDLQQALDQIVAYFTAHPEQLVDGAYTTVGVTSRREGNTRDGVKLPVVAFRGFANLSQFSRYHGPFTGTEPGSPKVVTPAKGSPRASAPHPTQ